MKALSLQLLAALLIVFFIAGCASIFGSGSSQSVTYSSTIGTAWQTEIERYVPTILQLYGYTLRDQRIEHGFARFATNWEYRNLYPDEVEAGVVTARIRITVESRSRGKTSFQSQEHERSSVSLTVENSFMMEDNDEWVAYEIGDGLQEFIRGLESEIRRQLEIRI